ncbi:ectoine hydroxylase [Planctomycetales bacterium ZRK34]|nr:ectoine hydroxylase [Planctomycetales bacterium ZRK34]
METDVYPSRVGGQPRRLERCDPILYGGVDDGPLSAQQLADYERDGFLILPNFLPPAQLDACLAELEKVRHDDALKQRDEAIVEPESNDLRSLFAVHRLSEMFASVAADPRIAPMAQQLLGSEVYIHQSRVNFKPGFRGQGFYWHSDFETWHVEDGLPRMRTVSCSILLTQNQTWNGPLLLAPGSHRRYISCAGSTPKNNFKNSLKKQEIGVPDDDSLTAMVDEGGIIPATGPAGTVVLFECNTMHGSASNISPLPRSNLFFVYNSIQNPLDDPYSGQPPRPEYIAARRHVEPIGSNPLTMPLE